MIEFVVEESCIQCNICVKICPQDVFDATTDGPPLIARQEDCHSCNTCELFCPVASLYVSPLIHPDPNIDKEAIIASGRLGSYARTLGWEKGKAPQGTGDDYGLQLRELQGLKAPDPADRVRNMLHEVLTRSYI